MPNIFISYRRSDSQDIVGRIHDHLEARVGEGQVYIDIDSIPYAKDFRREVKRAVRHADQVLVVIGPDWTAVDEQGKRRIDDETDPVRMEVAAAIRAGVPVLPILVRGASMPAPDDLPEPLRDLVYANAVEVRSGRDFRRDMERLLQAVAAPKRSSRAGLLVAVLALIAVGGAAWWLFGRTDPEPAPDAGAETAHTKKDAPAQPAKVEQPKKAPKEDPAPKKDTAPKKPTPPPAPPTPPAWESDLTRATQAAANGDWAAADKALAAATSKGLTGADVPATVRDGVDRWRRTPVIDITSPQEGARITGHTLVVHGTVERGGSAQYVTVLGLKRPERIAIEGGAFKGTANVESSGPVTLRVRIEGTDIETTEVTRSVTLDPPAPPPSWAYVSKHQQEFAQEAGVPVALENRFGMRFVLVPPGSFTMGSPESEPYHDGDERQVRVTLTKPFYMQITEVSDREFARAVSAQWTDPKDATVLPRLFSSYEHAESLVARLNEADPDYEYALPTEAQWEYACRAGTKTPFWCGQTAPPELVNYDGRRPFGKGAVGTWRGRLVAPGALPPNPWGLHEVHGNLWEWCHGWYGSYPRAPVTDPLTVGSDPSQGQVVRGGSMDSAGHQVRSASRASVIGFTHRTDQAGRLSLRAGVRIVISNARNSKTGGPK